MYRNYAWFDATTTLSYPCNSSSTFPYIFDAYILFWIYPCNCHKPQVSLFNQAVIFLSWANNIPFTGLVGQAHLNTMADSCQRMLDDEMLQSSYEIWSKQLKHFYFGELLGHGINEYLFLVRPGHLSSFTSKRKSN